MRRVVVPTVDADVVDAPEATHHLLHVLRARPGDRFLLLDGAGGSATGELLEAPVARFRVSDRARPAPPLVRLILLGIPKPALLEEAVTVGTEAGATQFILVHAQYTPPGRVRAERLSRVVRTAVAQCGRPDTPVYTEALSLSAAITLVEGIPNRWLATHAGGDAAVDRSPAVVAIGPEGGWADHEQATLGSAGFLPLGLGPFVLRTPTAVSAALARLYST